jgi:ethanolamine utilization microcompartment shell protein EutS
LILLGVLVVPSIFSTPVYPSHPGDGLVQSNGLPRQSATVLPQLTNPPAGGYFDHVVLIMMENEGISNICGGNPPPCNGAYSPYMSSLANTYGIGSRYLSIFHVSLPNYIGLIGGSTNGCTTTSGCPIMTGPNIIDRLESAGLTWRGYMESQAVAAGCDQINNEPYETDHNPFIHFQDILNSTARCNKVLLANPTSCGATTDCVLINHLNNASAPAPNFMWLTPNDCNNMRSTYSTICSNGCVTPGSACITAGDNYLKSLIPNILNSRTFTTTRSALFITFDEGIGYCPLNNSAEDCLYAVWAGSGVKTGFVTSTLYNQYSPTKTLEVNWNLPSLTSNDANATPMTEFFKPPPPDITISASPPSLIASAGAMSNSSITLASVNNFTGTVTLSSSSSPIGLSRFLNPTSVTLSRGGTGRSTLSVSTATAGNYTAMVIATSGSLSRNITVRVQVVDFAITARPTSVIVKAGTPGSSTVTIASLNRFTGAVALNSSIPSGLTCGALSPGSISGGSGSATVSCGANAVGNYTLIVTGSSGSLVHAVSITIRVTDFGIAGNPSSVIVPVGSNSTSIITLTSLGGYSGNVTLLVANISDPTVQAGGGGGSGHALNMAPLSSVPGVSISPSIISLGPGGQGRSLLNVTLSQNVSTGNYTVTLIAKDGSLLHTIYITIVATDFRFVYQPAPVTLAQGGSTTMTVWLQGFNSFQNTVNLTVQNPLGGPQGVLNSSTVNVRSTGPSGIGLTINVPSTTPPGNYTITVVATWRGVSRMLSITVSVRSATPAGIAAAVSYWMNHESLAESALVGLVTLVSLLAITSRSKVSVEHRGSKSWVFRGTHSSSSPSFRQQDLAWLMRRA